MGCGGWPWCSTPSTERLQNCLLCFCLQFFLLKWGVPQACHMDMIFDLGASTFQNLRASKHKIFISAEDMCNLGKSQHSWPQFPCLWFQLSRSLPGNNTAVCTGLGQGEKHSGNFTILQEHLLRPPKWQQLHSWYYSQSEFFEDFPLKH